MLNYLFPTMSGNLKNDLIRAINTNDCRRLYELIESQPKSSAQLYHRLRNLTVEMVKLFAHLIDEGELFVTVVDSNNSEFRLAVLKLVKFGAHSFVNFLHLVERKKCSLELFREFLSVLPKEFYPQRLHLWNATEQLLTILSEYHVPVSPASLGALSIELMKYALAGGVINPTQRFPHYVPDCSECDRSEADLEIGLAAYLGKDDSKIELALTYGTRIDIDDVIKNPYLRRYLVR